MAFRRRSSTAPYEVMGAGPRAHGPPLTPGSAPVQPVISKAPGVGEHPGAAAGGDGGWAARRHAPVVMRVPRGWLAAFALAALVIVGLVYWVGHTRGFHQGLVTAQQTEQQLEASQAAQYSVATGSGSPGVSTPAPSVNTPKPAPQPPPSQQPQVFRGPQGQRQPGFCYFVLLTSNQEGANALVKFLRDNGVDAGAFPAQHGRFYQVIALRGFRPDQLLSNERREYESQLRGLGRLWKRKATPRGESDLGDMYIPPEPYKGEPGA